MKVKKKTKEKILLGIILAGIFVMSSYYLSQKSGYFIDEGMTLFLSNAHYNGAVTSKSEYDFEDFLSTFVWRDTLTETIKNVWNA